MEGLTQEMMNIIGGVAALLSVGLLLLAIRSHRQRLRSLPAPGPTAGPLAAMEEGDGQGRMLRLGAALKPSDKKSIDELRDRVTQAGLYSRDALDLFLAVRMTLLLGGLVLSLLLIVAADDPQAAMFLFLFIMGAAVVGPGIWLSARTKARQQAIGRSLPATVDLLVTCLEAGLGLEQAMERVSDPKRNAEDLLASELNITLAEMKAGLETEVAWKKFSVRLGMEDVNTLTAVITQSAALGTNIAGLLRDHAKTMRQHRMLQLEEQAGKANAKLTLPLTTCLLPAVLILLLGPAVIMMMKSL